RDGADEDARSKPHDQADHPLLDREEQGRDRADDQGRGGEQAPPERPPHQAVALRPTIATRPSGSSSSPNDGAIRASTPWPARSAGTAVVSTRTFSWRSSSRRHVPSSVRRKAVISRTKTLGSGRPKRVTIAQSSATRLEFG